MAILDFFKEIPETTKKVIEYLNLNLQPSEELKSFGENLSPAYKQSDTGKNIIKGIIQGTAQSGGGVGLTASKYLGLANKPQLSTEEIAKVSPTMAKFKDILFGPDPIKSLETKISEGSKLVQEKTGVSKSIATPLSAIGVIGMTALDFTGLGGKSKALKTIVKINKIDDALSLGKKIGVADNLLDDFAKSAVAVKTEKEAKTLLEGFKAAEKSAEILNKANKIIPETDLKLEKFVSSKERQFLQSVKEARPDVELKIGGQYIPRSTDELSIKANNLIKDNIDVAEKLARTGTDENAVATASELIKYYSDEAQKATSQATKNALYEKASDIAHLTASNLTEQGRAVQAASIMGRLTPEGMLRFAAKEINKYNEAIEKSNGLFGLKKKIQNITPEQTKKILDEMNKIKDMPDGIKKAMAFKQLSNTISDFIPTPLWKKLITVWKAGLLTGIKTSGLNTFSNLFNGISETIKDVPATAVDSIASLFTKERTLGLTGRGAISGLKEGVEKGWRYLKTGFDERDVATKLDLRRVNFGKGKLAKGIQKYEETIFNILGAEDQPFYYGAKARSLQSQAIAKAKNAGKTGEEAKKFIDNLLSNPTDEMLKYATNDAEMAVFQNPTMLGKIAKSVQKTGIGEFVIPFGRTPSAVAMQIVNYSPIGIVKTIVENIGKGKFNQRLFSQGIGRGITGTGILYLGSELYKKGLINLNYPTTEREQKLWELEGRTPNSIKIGDKYRNVNVLGPAGNVLIIGGNFQKALQETGSPFQALSQAFAGGAKSLTESTFLQGISQVIDALDDPSRFAQGYFSNTISSIVPTIIGDLSKSFDDVERKTGGVFDKLKAKVPLLRQTLEPQINVLGQEKTKGGNFLETMIDPSRPSNILTSNVITELRRITDAGFDVSPTQLGDKNGYKGLTPEENTAIWRKSGELMNDKLDSLFNLEQYKNLNDEDKAKIIEDIIEKSKLYAKVQSVMDMLDGLLGQELKNKLSDLKKSGLMTKEVFNKYLELR
jgi:hypothetical protein